MSNSNESEAEIIEGCKKNDRRAQKSLYKLFYSKMNAASFRYTGSYDDAKDIVHDSFIQVFDKIHLYKADGSIEGWIRRIVVNKSIDFINKKNRLRVNISSETQLLLNDSASNDEYWSANDQAELDSVYESNLTEGDILEAIDMLKETYKVIFNMSVVDNFSHKEIAEKLGITEELSRIRLKRARAVLQSILLGVVKNKQRTKTNQINER